MVTLHVQSLDDEPESKSFGTLDDAIAYARSWFIEGYNNETIDNDIRARADEYAATIESKLRYCSEFYCPMFYERISIVDADRETS